MYNIEELKKQYPPYSGKSSKNFIDLTGRKFGNLLVLYRTLDKITTGGNKKIQWVCECQCENHTIVVKSGTGLRNGSIVGCGCTKGNRTKEVLPGTKFGNWEVIKRVPNHKNNQVYYQCKCTKCNSTIQEVSFSHLKNGRSTSCVNCRTKKMTSKTIKDETGKDYGFLHVERIASIEERPRQDRGVYWNCTCLKCGRKNVIVLGDYLRNGDTKSCGCIISYNENKIKKLLDKANINYTTQKKFNGLSSTGRKCDELMFDFAIYKNDILQYLIEYDGSQHFYYTNTGWNIKENFEKTRKNDLMKNQYCFNNNIPLIRIPYDMEYELSDLNLETTRFLITPKMSLNIIPKGNKVIY